MLRAYEGSEFSRVRARRRRGGARLLGDRAVRGVESGLHDHFIGRGSAQLRPNVRDALVKGRVNMLLPVCVLLSSDLLGGNTGAAEVLATLGFYEGGVQPLDRALHKYALFFGDLGSGVVRFEVKTW